MISFAEATQRINPEKLMEGEPPFVSIYLGTHRGSLEMDKDRLVFKNLLTAAEKTLQEGYAKKQYEGIIADLAALADDPAETLWRTSKSGLAILATKGVTQVQMLEYPVEELVVVSDSFHIKPLIKDWQFGFHYYVLALSRDRFELYFGDSHGIEKLTLPDEVKTRFEDVYPVSDDSSFVVAGSSGGTATTFHGSTSQSDIVEKEEAKFFRYVGDEVADLLSALSPCPVILAALTQHQAPFRSLSSIGNLVAQGIEKSPDSLTEAGLLEDARTIILAEQEERVRKISLRYGKAHAEEKASSDPRIIAQALVERKVDTLLIEEGKGVPGRFDPETGEVSFADRSPGTDDLFDDFAQAAYRQGGAVYLVGRDDMPDDSGVAALFRY